MMTRRKFLLFFDIVVLQNGFKNRQGRELHSIDSLNVVNIEIDEDKSSLKEVVYVNSILAYARIWVHFHDGRASDNIQLSLSSEVVLEYDFGAKEYIIANEDEIALVDKTF